MQIELSPEDHAKAQTAMHKVMELELELGNMRSRYLSAEMALVQRIDATRAQYEGLVSELSRQYITTKGTFSFSPEAGVFTSEEK